MQRLFDNPLPSDTEVPFDVFPDILQAIESEFDNYWENYARPGRDDKLKYPHVSVYDRSGDLTSRDNIFYRLINCTVNNLNLSKNDSFSIIGGQVLNITGGNGGSYLVLRDSEVLKISGVKKAFVKLVNCDTSRLTIDDCEETLIALVGSSVDSISSDFIRNCSKCYFRFSNFSFISPQNFSASNKDCLFYGNNLSIQTPRFSFTGGSGNFSRFENSSITGNEWIFDEESEHSAYFEKCIITCIHGFRGGGLKIIATNGTMLQAAKTFAGGGFKVALLDSIVGGEKTFMVSDSTILGINSTIGSPDFNSQSSNTTFTFLNCSINATETNFQSSNDRFHLDSCSLQATQKNLDGEFLFRAISTQINSSDTNFKGSGSVTLSNCPVVNASERNFDGSFKYLGIESCPAITSGTDGLKGSVSEAEIRRSSITSPHPLKCSINTCKFFQSNFLGHSILNANQSDFYEVNFGGPTDFNLLLVQQVNTKYGGPANFGKLCGRSSNCRFEDVVNAGQVNGEFGCCEFENNVNFGDSRITLGDINAASDFTVSGSVFASNVSVGGTLSISGGMNLHNVSASTLALSGSGALFNVSGDGTIEGCYVATDTRISGGGATVLSGGGVCICGKSVPKGQIIRSCEVSCILYGSQCSCCPGGCHHKVDSGC